MMSKTILVSVLMTGTLLLTACGQKGPLIVEQPPIIDTNSSDEEPSANKEPSANQEPSAGKEPSSK